MILVNKSYCMIKHMGVKLHPNPQQFLFLPGFSGLTKPGEVGEILDLYQLKVPSLDSKAKLESPCFFLHVAPFLQIICVLW